jgi:hypothetical protein
MFMICIDGIYVILNQCAQVIMGGMGIAPQRNITSPCEITPKSPKRYPYAESLLSRFRKYLLITNAATAIQHPKNIPYQQSHTCSSIMPNVASTPLSDLFDLLQGKRSLSGVELVYLGEAK